MLNEERVTLFASLIEVLAKGSPVMERLEAEGQGMDFKQLVRAVAETVPYPQPLFRFDTKPEPLPYVAPIPYYPPVFPSPNTTPSWPPPSYPIVTCQADGGSGMTAQNSATRQGDGDPGDEHS